MFAYYIYKLQFTYFRGCVFNVKNRVINGRNNNILEDFKSIQIFDRVRANGNRAERGVRKTMSARIRR